MMWYIVFDSANRASRELVSRWEKVPNVCLYTVEHQSFWGKYQINYILDHVMLLNPDWVYILDDDNLLVPNFAETMRFYQSQFLDKDGFIFQQYTKDGIRPIDIRIGKIDQAQFILKRGFIGTERYIMDYGGDGDFIVRMYNKYPDKFQLLDIPLSHYNRLKW